MQNSSSLDSESWPRFDGVGIDAQNGKEGYDGLVIGRVRLFFRISAANRERSGSTSLAGDSELAYVELYDKVNGDIADEHVGLFRVRKRDTSTGQGDFMVISISRIRRLIHLCPVFQHHTPTGLHHSQVFDIYRDFWVNVNIDMQSFSTIY
jgi:hypothetical protein